MQGHMAGHLPGHLPGHFAGRWMPYYPPTPGADAVVSPDGTITHAKFPQAAHVTVHLDSRDRDFAVYPSSTNFVVELPETLKNVSSAVLVAAEVPLSYYVFTAARGNTSLTVAVDGTSRTVTVPDGNYSTALMAAALKAALDAAFGKTFTVSFDPVTMKCTIAVAGTVGVDATAAAKPTEWGLGYYLGFPAGVVTTGLNGVTGTGVASMNPENYLLIDIEELNGLNQSAMYAAGGAGRKTFAKVPLNGDSYQYNFYDKTLTCVDLLPQIARMDRLRVSLRFHDGSIVDLNGEWSMSVEFVCTRARAS